jgi:hypothetical protein
MRKIHHFFRFLTLVASLSVQLAEAEFVCSSEVSYTWSKGDIHTNAAEGPSGSAAPALKGPDAGPGEAPAQASPADATPGSPGPAASSPPNIPPPAARPVMPPGASTVKFALVERRAGDEVSAKNGLATEVQRQKLRAAERCKRAHESFGECVTTKLSIRSSTLNSLSFSARAQAEKAIMGECEIQQGRCLAVEASAANCTQLGAPPAGDASAAQTAPTPADKPAEEPKADAKKDQQPAKPAAKKK